MTIPYTSVPDILRRKAGETPEKPALTFKRGSRWRTLKYGLFYERVLMTARGLKRSGLKPGDRVAILSENRPEWVIADIAIAAAGGVTVPVYDTLTSDKVAYILKNSGARFVFISNYEQYEKLADVSGELKKVDAVFSFDPFMGNGRMPVQFIEQVCELARPLQDSERSDIEDGISELSRDDLFTIIYTSGTTGDPKGVMLTHDNILQDAWYGLEKVEGLSPDDRMLSFLPLSHAFERTVGCYVTIMRGAHITFAESIDKVAENIKEVNPSLMISVPRLFEKIHARILARVQQGSRVKRSLFAFAMNLGRKKISLEQDGKLVPAWLTFSHSIMDKIVFSKVRENFGTDLRFFVSGGAPLASNIIEFFWVIGLPILEGYGLTETSPAISINTLDKTRFGTVGTKFDNVEIKLADDGELLIKGPLVMKGYWQNEKATKEMIDDDGWLHSGDIAQIDEDGYISIVDRKKDIIVTAGGKNIAPQPIEGELKHDRYIDAAFVYGDKRPYLVALIVPNFDLLREHAESHGIEYYDDASLVSHDKIVSLVEDRVERVNQRLPRYETIKKFSLLAKEFSVAEGELTPTMKIKRKTLLEKYGPRLECLYSEDGDSYSCQLAEPETEEEHV